MTDLKNEFSWSISKDRDFQLCKRKYYLRCYGSWGGWERDVDAFTKKIYILKNQANIPMLVGQVVHEAVAAAINSLKATTLPVDLAQDLAIGLFKKGWKESKSEKWKQDPKRKKNLFEHYYDEVPTRDKLEEFGQTIQTSVENFYSSDSFRFIKSIRPVNWLSREALAEFQFGEVRIFCKLDFALKNNDGVYIYDWKTGKQIKDDERQLAVYAHFAMDEWAVELENIRLFDVYLRFNTPVKIKVSPELLEQTRDYITRSAGEMKSLLDDPDNNIADIEKFPMTDNLNVCRRCSFKEICYPDTFRDL